ncbi:MAG: PD40 domain-containing protein [Anaerolineales bacterium]|nr:PD40 domain-containing protein [Anaerolineales bacterium]
MKPPMYRFSFLCLTLMLFLLAACTEPTATPSALPVPNVPPIEEVDGAILQWENGNNTRYAVTVEEISREGTFRYRIIVADGMVRAAQQQIKVAGVWQAPTVLDLETAANYTVDALLARIRNDVLGLGVVPMDVIVIFDSLSGYPTVVEAKALPTYNENGNVQLNRDLGYSFTSDVKVLIEDTLKTDQTPLLYVTRSGGEEAWCDSLRVFPDGSSAYSDDCREILLQLTPPPDVLAELVALGGSLSSIDETREEAGGTVHLVLQGTGTATADAGALEEAWNLGREMADMLSRPIGAGITLLYTRQGQLFGFDMRAAMGQPASLQLSQPLFGMAVDPNGSLLAYADSEKLHWLDLLTGETGIFFSNLPDSHYLPRGWNQQGQLLLQRVPNTGSSEWGWTSREDPSWHPIPLNEGAFPCDTGLSLNPNTAEFVIAAGGDCETEPGLTLVNIADGSLRKLIDAQSVPGSGVFQPAWSPDGNWIVFSLTLKDTPQNPQRIFLMRADGSELTALTNNTLGVASHPIWAGDGSRIFYSLQGADTGENDVYAYNVTAQTNELIFAGEGIYPVSLSPDDEFLIFTTGTDMKAYLLTHGELLSVVRGDEGEDIRFVSWLDTRTEK